MKKTSGQFMMGMYTLATVGLNIVVATFFGLGIGWAIDNKLFGGRTHPWFTLIFLLLGIVAGFRNMFKIIMSKAGIEDDTKDDIEDDTKDDIEDDTEDDIEDDTEDDEDKR